MARDVERLEGPHKPPALAALRRYQEIVDGEAERLRREERASLPGLPAVLRPEVPTDLRAALKGAQPALIVASLRDHMASMSDRDRRVLAFGLAELGGARG